MPLHEHETDVGVHQCIRGSTYNAICSVYGRGDLPAGLKELRLLGVPMADTFIAPPLWRERDSLGIVYMYRGFSFSTKACCEVGRAFAALEAAGSLARYPHFEAALKLCKDAMLANELCTLLNGQRWVRSHVSNASVDDL